MTSEGSVDAGTTIKHIRPGKRRTAASPRQPPRPQPPAETLDALQTVVQSWCKVATKAASKERVVQIADKQKDKKGPSKGEDCNTTSDATACEKTAVKSILRKPKYSSSAPRKPRLIEDAYFEDAVITAQKGEEKDEARVAVQEIVVERKKKSKNRVKPTLQRKSSGAVEGYLPKTNSAAVSKAIETHGRKEEKAGGIAKTTEYDAPLIFNSLADLMETAGTLPPQNEEPTVIEAELNFSCMDPESFDEERKEDREVQHRVFLGKQELFEDDDENTEPHRSDGIWDILGSAEPEDEEDEEPTRPPRAFLLLWKAIAQWVTPDAVAYVRDLRDMGHYYCSETVPAYDRSDVGVSRCAGLMAVMRMHIARCWKDLELPTMKTELRTVELQLANLLRLFDYSQPSPKFDTGLSRALTCMLMASILFPQAAIQKVPEPCSMVKMELEEYVYLVQSAILRFEPATEASTCAADEYLYDFNGRSDDFENHWNYSP
jgi:hypothetical protein